MSDTRLEGASKNLSAATFLALYATDRLKELTRYGEKYPTWGGNGKGDGITRTQICRTMDEARRLMLAARRELG